MWVGSEWEKLTWLCIEYLHSQYMVICVAYRCVNSLKEKMYHFRIFTTAERHNSVFQQCTHINTQLQPFKPLTRYRSVHRQFNPLTGMVNFCTLTPTVTRLSIFDHLFTLNKKRHESILSVVYSICG